MKRNHSPARTPKGSIFMVNVKFLWACLTGSIAWVYWPTTPEWWMFKIASGVMWLATIAIVIGAIRMMVKIYIRDREVAAMMAQGRAAHSSELAGADALKHAGMTDD